MQDQVISINARLGEAFGHDVAVFLGSGQTNGGEARAMALSGKCLLVYVTPEYLNMFHQDLGKVGYHLEAAAPRDSSSYRNLNPPFIRTRRWARTRSVCWP
jgi:hypothetical protein